MELNNVNAVHLLADKLEEHLGNRVYGELIDDLNVEPKIKEWLRTNVRWTLIDEETGIDLLEGEK